MGFNTSNNIKNIQRILINKKCGILVLSDKDTTHRWLIGEKQDHSLLFVPANAKPTLLFSALNKTQLFASNWNLVQPKNKDEQKNTIESLMRNIKVVAVSGSTCSLRMQNVLTSNNSKKIKFIDIEKELLELRATKSIEEIKSSSVANKLTAKCFNLLCDKWCTFSHEKDAIRFIKQFALNNNVELAFDPIVASGKNAAVPHHAISTKINSGFCVIDFGFVVNGYHADMTRTIYIGKPNDDELLTYDKLLGIQEETISKIKPGVKCSELHNFVVKSLGDKDAKLFIHSLGHGTGLEIHELPNISSSSDAILREGMIVTIEPGIYDNKKEYGIRIEDSILVTKKGCKILTKSAPKNLIIHNM